MDRLVARRALGLAVALVLLVVLVFVARRDPPRGAAAPPPAAPAALTPAAPEPPLTGFPVAPDRPAELDALLVNGSAAPAVPVRQEGRPFRVDALARDGTLAGWGRLRLRPVPGDGSDRHRRPGRDGRPVARPRPPGLRIRLRCRCDGLDRARQGQRRRPGDVCAGAGWLAAGPGLRNGRAALGQHAAR